jgi:CBS domain-containing protein
MNENSLKMFLFLSEILGRRVIDSKGGVVGKVVDMKARLGELFPRINSLCLKAKGERNPFWINWVNVKTIDGNTIKLKEETSKTSSPVEIKEMEILLKEEILDKQVVDTLGAKVERVNDVHLLLSQGELRIVHVDIGIRGILRRLRWTRWVDAVTNWLFAYQTKDKLISVKHIQPVASDPDRKTLKLTVTLRKLNEIHPSDLADILEELDKNERKAVFESLDVETAAETLEEVNPKVGISLIESEAEPHASDILEEMAPDEAVDLLLSLPEEKKEKLIQEMDNEVREKLRELLKFSEGSAGSIMTVEYLSLPQDKSVREAMEEFKTSTDPLETTSYIYLTNADEKLVGVLTLRQLILNPQEKKLSELMNRDVIKLNLGDDIDEVTQTFKKYKFMALPVVDEENHLKGIITLRDAVDAAFPEFQD